MTHIPHFFCWSKVGDEAGEPVARIIARKGAARVADGGVFLWGIGQSVGAGVRLLTERIATAEILFTSMVSKPKQIDSNPDATVLWTRAKGLDGRLFDMPVHSLVTSRTDLDDRKAKRKHWALVCGTEKPIDGPQPGLTFRGCDVVNIAKRTSLGGSQVTAAVEYAPNPALSGPTYSLRFRVELIHPYVVELTEPVSVPQEMRVRLEAGDLSVFEDLKALADRS